MLNAKDFYKALEESGIKLFCGVPDSLLKEFCACVADLTPAGRHIITANEGNALAVAAGHYLASRRPAAVYMQNSGLGNIVNPLLSLTDEEVYNIPALLIIGWRGEPGQPDEPQHIKQGKVTLSLLETMGISYEILEDVSQVQKAMEYMKSSCRPYAFVVRKGTFEEYKKKPARQEKYVLGREAVIKKVISLMGKEDIVVSTTGMISREVYENRRSHEKDFLTVGSMGHASSIALGIALNKPRRKVFCFDGDGSLLMHMGAVAVIGSMKIANLKHIVFNNEVHDSVGGQPTVMGSVDLRKVLEGSGYNNFYQAFTEEDIERFWGMFYKSEELSFMEIKVKSGARKDLGRPKEKPVENKNKFMEFIEG